MALELKVQEQDKLKVADLERQIALETDEVKKQQLKAQRGAFDPLDPAYNPDDLGDADVYTLKAGMEAGFLIFRGKFQAAYTVIDALGKFKDKTTSRLSAEIGLPLGKLILGLGVRGRQNVVGEIDSRLFKKGAPANIATLPEADQKFWKLDQQQKDTLVTAFFTVILQLTDSWIVSLEALTEEKTTNVSFPEKGAAVPFPSGEYENSAVTTSLIFIF